MKVATFAEEVYFKNCEYLLLVFYVYILLSRINENMAFGKRAWYAGKCRSTCLRLGVCENGEETPILKCVTVHTIFFSNLRHNFS